MPQCQTCGSQVPEHADVCPDCGMEMKNAPASTPGIPPPRVSGSSETKTYGKSIMAREHEGKHTLPRRSFFGKDADKRFRLFKGLRTLLSPIELLFSGKLPNMPMTSWRRASP